MRQVKEVVEQLLGQETRAGRITTSIIQLLIVVSLVSFTISTTDTVDEELLDWVEIVSVVVFTAEYLARVWTAENKTAFILSFFGIVDLVAILPFYLQVGVDLRSVRAVRLLRVFRMAKLMKYSAAAQELLDALTSIKRELVVFLWTSASVLYLASVGIYYFEKDVQPDKFGSIPACLWWAVATLTTVGYGDVYPVTAGGKLFTSLILILGIGVIAVPSGLFASALSAITSKSKTEHDLGE